MYRAVGDVQTSFYGHLERYSKGVDMALKKELTDRLRRYYHFATGEEIPLDCTDEEVVLMALAELMEDHYL